MTLIAAKERLVKIYKPEDGYDLSGLVWPGGVKEMPKDHPPCGWENEFCKTNPLVFIIGVACAFAVLTFGLVSLTLYIRKKR